MRHLVQKWLLQEGILAISLSGVLLYLRMSLNGAILETLRVSSRPGGPWPDGEDRPDSSAVWDRLQALLSNERERRLAYLLYHCGLEPAEIVRGSPQDRRSKALVPVTPSYRS